MLAVQVKGGDSLGAAASNAKKKTTKSAKSTVQSTLDSSRLLPPSTNISSPAAQKKGKGKAPVFYDEDNSDEEEAYEMHDNGYAKDNFVVPDEDGSSSDFETMGHSTTRRKHKQRPLGPPISQDVELASLDDIHKDITAAFLEEAVPLAEEIRNANSLRQVIFTRLQLRAMAMNWTLSLDAMKGIPSIDKDKVARFGARFLPKIREWHQKYQEVMGQPVAKPKPTTTPRRTSAAHSIVDLVSTDSEEEMDDGESEGEDDDDDEGQGSKYFAAHQPSSEVQAWHEQLAQAARNAAPAPTPSRARASSSGSTWRGKSGKSSGKRSFVARKGSGSFNKGRSNAGVAKRKAPSKRTSTGSSRPASGAFGASRGGGGRGGGRGGGGGEQTRIDLMPM